MWNWSFADILGEVKTGGYNYRVFCDINFDGLFAAKEE